MNVGRRIALSSLGLGLSAVVFAQTAGSILGRVTDENGSPLPGVTVEAQAGAGGLDRVAMTDHGGNYGFAGLPAGDYRLAFRLPGFAEATRTGVVLSDAPGQRVDCALTLAVSADVVVTGGKAEAAGSGQGLIGTAAAASQGSVSGEEINERPLLRPGEVLETVPGLVISQHSGEGKANQYYLRGFDLDHGTDFATTVAGIPVNMPSHAHGQGYSDLNFVIPELVGGVRYEKGLYRADQGDFAAAGSAQVDYVTSLEKGIAKVGGGQDGYARALAADSLRLAEGDLLWAVEAGRDNGPWVHPDAARKYNGILRYSRRNEESAFSVTAMGYANRWNSTDQVPDRAIGSGFLSRFGAIDPTDGGETSRWSLSADWQKEGLNSLLRATAYAVDYRLKLFSNFTYALVDPVNGDQFGQADRRVVTGLNVSQRWSSSWFGREATNTVGVQVRNDAVAEDGLFHTRARQVLGTVSLDHLSETSVAAYVENGFRWSEKLRTVAGLRADFLGFRVGSDDPANLASSGAGHASLLSPKFSLVLGPWGQTEFYANAGYGFHSNDVRGATITEDPTSGLPAPRVTPLARAKGAEVGVRTELLPRLQATVSLWGLESASEIVFEGDTGTTQSSRPGRRSGVEFAGSWSPLSGLRLDAGAALSRTRFADADPSGNHIPGSVGSVLSAGVAEDDVAGFFGSVRVRYFGPRPLTADDGVRSKSSTLVNLELGREILPGARLGLEVFNVFDTRVSDAAYYYVSRLPGEPLSGVADVHTHPAGPRTARVSLNCVF